MEYFLVIEHQLTITGNHLPCGGNLYFVCMYVWCEIDNFIREDGRNPFFHEPLLTDVRLAAALLYGSIRHQAIERCHFQKFPPQTCLILWVMTDHILVRHVYDISQSIRAHLYISIYLSFLGFYASTLISVSARERPSRFINFSNISEMFNNVHYVNCIMNIFEIDAIKILMCHQEWRVYTYLIFYS